MFNMSQIGRRIAEARKARNMTQMALADAMGVSFQAVSNWERGQSMPDIAKLPELSELLGLSIDALLSGEKAAGLVERIIEGNADAYIKEEALPLEAVADVAPLLPPRQAETFSETVLNREGAPLRAEDLAGIAPFVGDNFLGKWVTCVVDLDDLTAIAPLAPFLSEEVLDALVDKCMAEKIEMAGLVELAPFLSEETLDRLVKQFTTGSINLSALEELAPFLPDETLDHIAETSAVDAKSVSDLSGLAPFFSEEALDTLSKRVMAAGGKPGDLAALAPFLSEETLHAIAEQWIKAHGFKGLEGIAPFL
ncbi:MAG: helix-turn-helix domain-containing protein [Oscillospiraceae bacterium]|jgi:transcriptional regulator with XRE-family HTH domain|nr:helix-turn-helix domain-containing protein [Oscillospiraceae bacterium]